MSKPHAPKNLNLTMNKARSYDRFYPLYSYPSHERFRAAVCAENFVTAIQSGRKLSIIYNFIRMN